MRKLALLFLAGIIFFSCNRRVSREQLIEYIRDSKNGCIQSSSNKGLDISVYFKPYDILAYGELLKLRSAGKANVDSIINQYSNKLYFTISLQYNKQELLQKYINNNVAYTQLISYLSYEIKNDISLRAGDKVYYPATCNFTRTYGVSNTNNILLIFDKTELKNLKEFTIKLNSKWNDIGNHSFPFKIKNFNKVPSIDFKNIK